MAQRKDAVNGHPRFRVRGDKVEMNAGCYKMEQRSVDSVGFITGYHLRVSQEGDQRNAPDNVAEQGRQEKMSNEV